MNQKPELVKPQQEALAPLQNDHHHALRVCSRIRDGLKKEVEQHRIRKYIDWFTENFLEPHFDAEEQLIKEILGNNARVKKALANHRRIKRLLSCSCDNEKVLNRLEEELGTYIRFEERTLYREINLAVTTERFAEIEKHHQQSYLSDDDWEDHFWTS